MRVPYCIVCEKAVYCPTWGQYKCTKFNKWIYDPFSTRRPQCCESLKYPLTALLVNKCHCEDCMERGDLDGEMEE